MNKKSVIIKLFSVFFLFTIFIFCIHIEHKQSKKQIKVKFNMKIDSTKITGLKIFGVGRGGVFYKKNHFIPTSAKLLENKNNFQNW